MLKELQHNRYLFCNLGMLDDLLGHEIIELLAQKQLEKAETTINLKLHHSFYVISHPPEKCVKLKECIMQLIRDQKIILDIDDSIKSYLITPLKLLQ